jgi:hypothetical protein
VLKLIGSHFNMLRSIIWKYDSVLKRLRRFQIAGGGSHGIAFWLPGPKIWTTGCRVPRKVGNGRGVHSQWFVYVSPYVEGLVQTY